MTNELALSGAAGLGTNDEASMLLSLLALTSDAVIVFDADGTVLLANEEAERVFRTLPGGLVSANVRDLFPPAATIAQSQGSLGESLPFALDGSSTVLVCEGRDHTHLRMRVKCERVAVTSQTFLLCAHALEVGHEGQEEDTGLVDELSRANRRLSGTLSIVLGTLDSLDVGTLFSRTLDEITKTMDAWATLAYMAEKDGYRLRGATKSLGNVSVPAFVAYDSPLAQMACAQERSSRMHVLAPSRTELRRGEVCERTVVCEDTGASFVIPAVALPPFACFVTVPVWFGGHMIAMLIVGWRHVHRLRKDDTNLLDAVAEYLSVQLAGAFAAMRAQHAEQLDSLGSELRECLLTSAVVDERIINKVFADVAEGIGAMCIPILGNVHQRTVVGVFSNDDLLSLPGDLFELLHAEKMPSVADVTSVDGLVNWLEQAGEPTQGLFVALGQLDGADRGFMLLREAEEEPLEEGDVSFVRNLAEDVLEVKEGERARKQDKRIAQALQRGMRNELQKVDGLSAQSIYSSATEAAYVGGDFYDLVRLPKRRACVIMGDVSGKGVEAASVSSAVKTALGAYAWEGLTPARMVSLLNEFLLGFSRIETFATLFVGIVNLEDGVLEYCSAGHPPALLVRAESHELVTLGVQSGVVGAFLDMQYQNGRTSIRDGDILVLYTDGVTESRNRDGAFFGEDGLRDALLRECAEGYDGLCDRILGAVQSFAGESLEDDVALVVLRFDEVGRTDRP